MTKREKLKGQWNEVKGRLKDHWGELTEDDLRQAEGSTDQLVGVVQQKTGATKGEIERFIDNILGSSNLSDQAAETVQQYADAAQAAMHDAAATARESYHRLAANSSEYGRRVAETVRSRPTESLAIAFGVGIAAGALLFFGRKR